ncbi:MAG: hypothetical protein ACLUR5_13605 [Eubacterium ventriosum]
MKNSGVNTNNSKIKIKMLQKIFVSVHIGKHVMMEEKDGKDN